MDRVNLREREKNTKTPQICWYPMLSPKEFQFT